MRLYNPLIESDEPLFETRPARENPVTIYVCGITPYDTTHLGHAFTYAVADILIRYLEYRGHPVKYVQNVTDIDDDILRRAKADGEDWIALGNRWTRHFIKDMISLNVRPPEHYPRATEVIPDILNTVRELLDIGVAYEANGSVYYRVASFPEFGDLSRMDRVEMLTTANERGNNPDDANKGDPLDFVLWQAAAPGEPTWESPWGLGRPGWHIECSTMATKFLGQTIDVHGGGGDLLFPHHACEIAQIEPLTRAPFVRFWMHAAMVRHEGEKMSKSLGNLVMARDLLKTYSADALRLYLGMHHYQIEWSADRGRMEWAARLAERFTRAAKSAGGDGHPFDSAPWEQAFQERMDANLDSPGALGVLDDFSVALLLAAVAGENITKAQLVFRNMTQVFGLVLGAAQPEKRVRDGWGTHLSKFSEL